MSIQAGGNFGEQMVYKKEIEVGGRKLSIEAGKVAKQANGSAWAQYGETIVLAAVVSEKNGEKEEQDFFPLTVDYREKTSAAGKIPGGFFKREGRPSEKEILSARLIDRPIRPMFPEWYRNKTEVQVMILSADGENDGDTLGAIAASAALAVSDIPFAEPVAEVTVGRIAGEFVINPIFSQKEACDLQIVVAGSENSIVMVEGECAVVTEGVLLGAINFAQRHIREITAMIEELAKECGKTKMVQPEKDDLSELARKVKELSAERMFEICRMKEKEDYEGAKAELTDKVTAELGEEFPDKENSIKEVLYELEKAQMRANILNEHLRLDGRGIADIRPITGEVQILPRTHGSALFTRGQTQALVTTTLGSKVDEQRIDSLEGDFFKRFLLHYNFPSFSTGETSRRFGVSRREIGHGNLAERALKAVLPPKDKFPYTIRIVSEILESNGSSSMATVCGGCLSLMDAGVPISSPVAGVAMGLVKEGDKHAILTDILGSEDHLGDMDFKVAGTKDGVTAIQMDIKIAGISAELMEEALERAKQGRLYILDKMAETMTAPREKLSPYAPNILFFQVAVDKIGLIIGPGGKMIREISEKTGADINIEDDGTIQIVSTDQAGAAEALRIISGMVEEPEIGRIYEGPVKKITDFGAFIEIMPGREGLLHISNMEHFRVNKVTDILKVGEMVKVKLMNLDSQGKMELSRKALIERPGGSAGSDYEPRPERGGGGGRGFRSGGRGDRR